MVHSFNKRISFRANTSGQCLARSSSIRSSTAAGGAMRPWGSSAGGLGDGCRGLARLMDAMTSVLLQVNDTRLCAGLQRTLRIHLLAGGIVVPFIDGLGCRSRSVTVLPHFPGLGTC